tara:strand:+ start:258 stop:461 length:204 start_codon:yes stop_codon:yes gene_type:complete
MEGIEKLLVLFGIIAVPLFLYYFFYKLTRPDGRKHIVDELKKNKFWDTEVFAFLVILLFIYLWYIDY